MELRDKDTTLTLESVFVPRETFACVVTTSGYHRNAIVSPATSDAVVSDVQGHAILGIAKIVEEFMAAYVEVAHLTSDALRLHACWSI